MKLNTILLPALFVLPVLLCACSGGDSKAGDNQAAMDKMADKAKNAMSKAGEEVKKATTDGLASVDKLFTELKNKAAASKDASNKGDMDQLTTQINDKRKVIAAKLEELKTAAGEKLSALSAELPKLVADLKKMVDDAMAKLK